MYSSSSSSSCPHKQKHNIVVSCFLLLFLYAERASAQATTDPSEAAALNSILRSWGVRASSDWNKSGEPCSGAAIDSTDFNIGNINPFIKCDCSYNNNSTCHITQLKVYALDVVGVIPEELQNLTYLFELQLSQNYLTGPLPAFIGNFTAMQYLSIGINGLSGNVPKELGKLQKLVSLGMGTNNFSGSLPLEFGNMTNLQKLYIDSAGVGGELPSTLSKLNNLETLWASDNNFTGKIPDFIGSWTNLKSLRFQGNSFQGPIPSSISKLIKLNDLRIGDITNGSSSLGFISTLTSLSTLILRNSKISDTIPANFTPYMNLQKLDLSFNNITGALPDSLFNSSSLTSLFLGNNSLSGSLPIQKSESLTTIDLSYNQFSGTFPSWVSRNNLQLNLVANNFVLDSSNSSVLPPGLNCLQRDIPCYRNSPIYSTFAVNCGASTGITASDGNVYDADKTSLTAASYYVTDENRWGVSNVGTFAEASNASYVISNLAQVSNTLDPELFQTARMSPSSLRYYGLGLENGNYTIKLQFAELGYPDIRSWKSVGKRVFDIYIQGQLAKKDFDIRKEAGGTSFKTVVENFNAPVTNNFLEIHFFWAGKGTCCVPSQGYYGPSISAISVSPKDFIPTVSNKPPTSSSSSKTGVIVGIVVAVGVSAFLAAIAIFLWRQKKRRLNAADDEELSGMDVRPDTFSYAELRTATDDFNRANMLGEGGFGPVFKGKLSDGRLVAVKQLSVASHQGKRQFIAEIATISAVQHRNLVKLYGCCIEGEKRILVYEYLENKSLDQAIFGTSNLQIDWPTRFEICLGTARGLAYLHEESRIRIVHRDVKASNILLDVDLSPKISDFGLAKLYDDNKTHITTRVAGTIGYLAPEYAMRGHLTEKADVFGFGVVVLEVLSGRRNADTTLDEEKVYLLEWAWHLHENNRELELVDPSLSSYDQREAARLIGIALLCTQASPMLRPYMSRVVAMMTGDIEVSEVTVKPGYLTEYQIKDLSSNFNSSDFFSKSSASTSNSQDNIPLHVGMAGHRSPPTSSSQSLIHSIISEGR
ncbi:putative LRR receptor-like serine/threonine-protein kinase isoform X2 [Iris pallida]|uniref:non-specific serine/threonine protein kinase n=1 Tax=Iris pallida TaxID=29817 RepID=A0AAX6EMM1_IRIPA|nr:putative LRR receptor-like serine/threonine-protein kinase isoform X2 [Iris pallida]